MLSEKEKAQIRGVLEEEQKRLVAKSQNGSQSHRLTARYFAAGSPDWEPRLLRSKDLRRGMALISGSKVRILAHPPIFSREISHLASSNHAPQS